MELVLHMPLLYNVAGVKDGGELGLILTVTNDLGNGCPSISTRSPLSPSFYSSAKPEVACVIYRPIPSSTHGTVIEVPVTMFGACMSSLSFLLSLSPPSPLSPLNYYWCLFFCL